MRQITETFRLQDIDKARARLIELRAAGIKCWMTRGQGPLRHDGYLTVSTERED